MTKRIDHLTDWYERLPVWAAVLLWPVLAAILLMYSSIAIVVFLVFVVPYLLAFGTKRWVQNPAEKLSLTEVQKYAESLSLWFDYDLAEHPEEATWLGPARDLAREFLQLATRPRVGRETAEQFAERVQSQLKGYKGIQFVILRDLSSRLVQLSDNGRAAEMS